MISKKVREDAALICAIAALRPVGSGLDYFLPEIANDLGMGRRGAAARIACDAYSYVVERTGEYFASSAPAEAESLIRTGWTL